MILGSIYGIHTVYPDPFERERQARAFEYLKARIVAEKLNPAPDYDNDRQTSLLVEIAVSETSAYQRQELVKLLGLDDDDEQ